MAIILMDKARWDKLVRGIDCPYDAPRVESNDYWDLVASLTVTSLYLAKNQTYRGQCLLIFDSQHAVRPQELSKRQWLSFCADLYKAEGAISHTVRPDHINLASLGNLIPHLHWHIVPRYRNDPRWGAPIWQTSLADMPDTRLGVQEREELIGRLRESLSV